MAVTKRVFILVVCISIVSALLGSVINILNTNSYEYERSTVADSQSIQMTDTESHLLWFIQISDIHISIFKDSSRITEFREFCDITLKAISPSLVLATGDLTDAKTVDSFGSQQFEKEWIHYHDILQETDVLKRTVWLDIRGNHDNFNVLDKHSKENYYLQYSIQGKKQPRSYYHQIKKGPDVYTFIGIDACTEPGPKRPFNFVGILDKNETENIKDIIANVEKTASDHTIFFGHYPTSCILSDYDGGTRELIGSHKKGTAYLCGHLHTLAGMVPKMYTLQHAGFLELELADWKDNRVYRILAVDRGFLSFVDVKHREWPIILITNPKHALFVIPHKEDMNIIRNSTHIRVLVFSLSNIEEVKVRIDDEDWKKCKNINGPLYTSPWSPKKYLNGLHTIEVWVKDKDGREKLVSQPFSLDYTRINFDLLPQIVLMSNANTIVMFLCGLLATILPLCIIRYLHRLVIAGQMQPPKLHKGFMRKWMRKLWILSTVDRIFWPLVLYPLYLIVGPWSAGYIVEDQLGIIFAWGIYVNGMYLPGSLTYGYGFIHIPLTFILANGVDHRFEFQVIRPGCKKELLEHISLHVPFVTLICLQIAMSYFFWLALGLMAFILGPLRTWAVILAMILWYQALILPEKCTRQAAKVWSKSWKK